ncbi:UNKNOWN [Stylonychia lemnae]|uniref:Uncharacterized protein n=1 Tax=Stylonychia lemnae TaxID=5949 RepID=A0A078B746_STYLE|nr:UNKNOWN [Stylonychia lemnae]|eukprot:CDW90224.1 UNKNOWN [Stylonychia lemnae]
MDVNPVHKLLKTHQSLFQIYQFHLRFIPAHSDNVRNALTQKFVKNAPMIILTNAHFAMKILNKILLAFVNHAINHHHSLLTANQLINAQAVMMDSDWYQVNVQDATMINALNALDLKIVPYVLRNIKLYFSPQHNGRMRMLINVQVQYLFKTRNLGCNSGQAEYSYRAMIKTSICEVCNSTCEECQNQIYCSSCKKGYYLEKISLLVSYGYCKLKQSNFTEATLYVTNKDITENIQLRDGSISKPFGDLEDAIERAYEIAASFYFASITILLQNSVEYGNSHYLLRSARDFYISRYIDKDSQGLTLLIKPDQSVEGTMIVYNKRAERFQMNIGGGLTIQNIEFDGLDSIIPYRKDISGCLGQKINCCQNINGIISSLTTTQCIDNLNNDFWISKQMIQFYFHLQGVKFRNYFFNFNSFIETNDVTSKIQIIDSKFEYFSSCGAIIRNFRTKSKPSILDKQDYSTAAPFKYIFRSNQLQYEASKRLLLKQGVIGYSQSSNQPQVISNNTFLSNAGYFQNVGLFIRAYVNSNIYESTVLQNFQCNGIQTFDNQTFQVDMNKFQLNNNVFESNYGSANQGLVDITGIKILSLENNIFKSNGESSAEVANKLSDLSVSNLLYVENDQFGQYESSLQQGTSSTYMFMMALIQLNHCSQLRLKNISFEGNWIESANDGVIRAQILMLKNFYGSFILDQSKIDNHLGLLNPLPQLLYPNYASTYNYQGGQLPLLSGEGYGNTKI